MWRLAFNPQLLVDEVLNFVRILMVVAGATMALLLLFSLMFAGRKENDPSQLLSWKAYRRPRQGRHDRDSLGRAGAPAPTHPEGVVKVN